jgi:Trypsin-co-occurring domain 1
MNAPQAQPKVEIHAPKAKLGAAAGIGDTLLSKDQIDALQVTITTLVAGFEPPAAAAKEDDKSVRFESLEVELGFKLELAAGAVLKLVFDASSEASITAKVTWSRPK